MSINVALCTGPAMLPNLSKMVTNEYGTLAKKFIFGSVPADFAELKNSTEPTMLIVYGPAGKEVLRDLTDDYESAGKDARRLKFVYSITAGVDVFDLPPMAKQLNGIPFYNGQGCYTMVLTEWAIYCIQYFNRSVWRLFESKHAKKWDPFVCKAMSDQKLVVVGYGNIGQSCGKAARFFGMNVTGIRRNAKPGEVDENGVHLRTNAELDDAIRDADYVLGVLPGTPETKHLFNMEFFKKMRRDAVFINIGRGICQNDNELAQALHDNVIRGAAIDVAEGEPLTSESPLWSVPDDKLLISPHCADMTEDILLRSVKRAASLTQEYVDTGKVDTYVVDPFKGY